MRDCDSLPVPYWPPATPHLPSCPSDLPARLQERTSAAAISAAISSLFDAGATAGWRRMQPAARSSVPSVTLKSARLSALLGSATSPSDEKWLRADW